MNSLRDSLTDVQPSTRRLLPPAAPPPHDLAVYTAGLFDGEGCIMFKHLHRVYVPRVRVECQITQSARYGGEAVLRQFRDEWGIGRVYLQYAQTERRVATWNWRCYVQEHCVYFLEAILPWLRLRRAKAEDALTILYFYR